MINQRYPYPIYPKGRETAFFSNLPIPPLVGKKEYCFTKISGLNTLRSISDNHDLVSTGILNDYIRLYDTILPEFFMEPAGIHGVNHARRVLLLCLVLSKKLNLNKAEKSILVEASKFHDIGRFNNEDCEIHGCLSFKKLIKLKLIACMDAQDMIVLQYVIENHCIADELAFRHLFSYGIKEKTRALKLLKIFKDSDALDRVRTDDLDEHFLRFNESKQLQDFSWKLFLVLN